MDAGIFSTDEAACVNDASMPKLTMWFETRSLFSFMFNCSRSQSGEGMEGQHISYFVLPLLLIKEPFYKQGCSRRLNVILTVLGDVGWMCNNGVGRGHFHCNIWSCTLHFSFELAFSFWFWFFCHFNPPGSVVLYHTVCTFRITLRGGRQSDLIWVRWGLSVGGFKSSPGDCNVQPTLSTSAVEA